jgi:hypothetical protein
MSLSCLMLVPAATQNVQKGDYIINTTNLIHSSLGGLVVSMLASGTQDRGFKPGRNRRIFLAKKIHSMASFGGEVKPSVPCRRFAACKRTLQ